jgi:hypothetical protein
MDEPHIAMLALLAAPLAFTPRAVPGPACRSTVRTQSPLMVEETNSRRELFAKVGAAVLGAAAVDSASAKAGQFGKIGIFGMEDISSPFQPGGPKAGADATFGYAKSSGPKLATGYESDVAREKAAFLESSRRISELQPKIESKTWWFVRDQLRSQAYNMRSSMLALNAVNADKAAALKAYKKYWSEVEMFDLACSKKESALAQKEYGDVLSALKAYTDLI